MAIATCDCCKRDCKRCVKKKDERRNGGEMKDGTLAAEKVVPGFRAEHQV